MHTRASESLTNNYNNMTNRFEIRILVSIEGDINIITPYNYVFIGKLFVLLLPVGI